MVMGLFFSRGMSFAKWHELELLDREKLVYEKHLAEGTISKVYCFTYGAYDANYSHLIHEDLIIISMPIFFNSKIGINIYSFLLPIIKFKHMKKCDILKNDQMDGSWSAVIAKIFFRKKLLIRTGFTLSVFMNRKGSKVKELIAILMESFAYYFCDFATVSSKHSKLYIMHKYNLKDKDISVLYNYINVDKFNILKSGYKNDRLLFIGRLDQQKNLVNLFYALNGLDVGIDLYGDGTLKNDLMALSKVIGIDARFMGKVSNAQMPEVMNKYKYYILPSLYEGMPKTLIEAMCCGLICMGTDTLGINEVINNKNGYLIPSTNASDISKVIINVIKNNKITNIDTSERVFCRDLYSLDRYTSKESKILSNLVQ